MISAISERTLARAQAVSGLVFAVFLLLHLVNLGAAVAGQPTYDRTMATVRGYYQLPVVELVLVLGAANVHMAVGIVRILRRRRALRGKPVKPPTLRVRLHRYTGYYIMLAFGGHVVATRLVPLLTEHVPDYSFLNFSLSTLPGLFFPYYILLAFSGAYHLSHGAIAALSIVGLRLPRRATSPRSTPFWVWAALCGVLALAGVLALGGVLYAPDQSRFPEWQQLVDSLLS
jgi:succinate dehydrogenase/fumarate reductase cytochrome b subunit